MYSSDLSFTCSCWEQDEGAWLILLPQLCLIIGTDRLNSNDNENTSYIKLTFIVVVTKIVVFL